MDSKELKARQQWSLMQKIDHSLGVIDQFVSRLDGKVYLSFSGGKDSTVLMYLCEMIKPNIQCVFVNTGCEHPSVVQFVRKMKDAGHNITSIRPKMSPREVWAKYGFPLVSKNVADMVASVRRNPTCAKSIRHMGDWRDNKYVIPLRWRYLIEEPYDTSNACCIKLKKSPSREFEKETGLKPILGTMASESLMRAYDYISRGGGCNLFSRDHTSSMPLAIWLDDDIWGFIKDRNIEIADVYYKGATRTGCVACGFGANIKNDPRFRMLYESHPKYYNMVMNFENHGVTYREALRKMMAVTNMYLPDENQHPDLFNEI